MLEQLPPQSPDLNIIEHVWAAAKKKLAHKKRSRSELEHDVLAVLEAVKQEGLVCALCASMPSRCLAVIEAGGEATRY